MGFSVCALFVDKWDYLLSGMGLEYLEWDWKGQNDLKLEPYFNIKPFIMKVHTYTVGWEVEIFSV